MTRSTTSCVRCERDVPKRGVSWPEGYVCRRCYQRATRIRGACPGCGVERLLPGLDGTGTPICVDCAGIPVDLACTRCGEEDEPHRRGLCARCCLRDDLTVLLDDGSGRVRPALVELFEALCAQPLPRSALIWLRNPDVRRLLVGFARGSIELSHDTLDAEPSQRTAMHLRELLMRYRALPQRDRVLITFELWLAEAKQRYSPATARLLNKFATWHHLRRMRELSAAGRLRQGSAHTAKQEITVAGQFLTHLEQLGVALPDARQTHLDAWLAAGPSTRYTARNFVVWAVRNQHLPKLEVPHRVGRSTPLITQQLRIDLLRHFLHSDDLPTPYRLAAVLLLLYAQPVTKISRLRLDDVVERGSGLAIRLGDEPAQLPDPVATLLREHLRTRHNTSTAANADSPWLFPGYRAGQPLHYVGMMDRLRDGGVPSLGARNSALRQLVLDMPPAVAARALGYSAQVTEHHARQAGTTWSTYVMGRRTT